MAAPVVVLAPGVVRIPTLGDYVNSFAFVDADGQVTLVDCGLKRAPGTIVKALAAIGKHPSDVTRIVLTHAHLDHAGGAGRMVEQTGVDGVSVHTADAGYVRAGHPPPTDTSVTGGRLVARMSGGFAAAPVAHELTDGEVIDVGGGLRVVHTPGHSPGHMSLLHEPTRVLITGDALFNVLARIRWPVAALCTSFRQTQQTAHVLGEPEYDVVAFTHGPEIRERARESVRDSCAARPSGGRAEEAELEPRRVVDRLTSLPLDRLERADGLGERCRAVAALMVAQTRALDDDVPGDAELPLLGPTGWGAQLAVVGRDYLAALDASAYPDRVAADVVTALVDLRRRLP